MVVRFPSQSPEPDAGAGGAGADGVGAGDTGRLAPVTPLRRGIGSAVPARPTAHPAGRGTPWNNTWGDEAAAAPEPEEGEAERTTRTVKAVTIRQLARRGMSRWELEQVLLKRDMEPDVFGPELDRLEVLGVIDDASLATSVAFTQHSRKGLGRSVIEADLKRRHIAPELIEIALADIEDEDELEKATELAVKRVAQLSSYDDETARRRLHGFLARKGYDSNVVRQAMDAAFATRGRRGVRFE